MRSVQWWTAFVLSTWAICSAAQERAALSNEDRLYLKNVQFHCEWAKKNAPPGNPVVIRACAPGAPQDAQQAYEDSTAWWKHWQEDGADNWLKLSREFESALKANLASAAQVEALELKKRQAARTKAAKAKQISALPTMSISAVCALVRDGRTPEALQELIRRREFAAPDNLLISKREIVLGMPESAMRCALGNPERTNRSVGAWGVHIQYVYPGVVVYVENGSVTSWQD